MANSLLDFVLSLVRDPDAAARYAADPEQAILDADLTDVTSADVNALIPVVSESMPSLSDAVPVSGLDESAANVWSSGAATAAFDSFDPPAFDDIPGTVAGVIDDPGSGFDVLADADIPAVAFTDDLEFVQPVIDDAPIDEALAVEGITDAPADVQQPDVDAGGFDLFD